MTANFARAKRRAYSADQAVPRARERMNAKIDAAIRNGNAAYLQKRTAKVMLRLPTNKFETLVSTDGTVSDAGRYYYEQLGIAAPTIFAYEQPLLHGKWVKTFDGGKKQVQRMGDDGWEPTAVGLQYFKYNRYSFRIEYPVREARPIGKKRKVGQPDRWQFVQEVGDRYMKADGADDITVGELK